VRSEDVRRWLEQRRRAEEREHAEQRGRPPPPREALARGLELIELASRMLGWPIPEDDVSRGRDERTRAVWKRLRERLAPR
jgi:hypothetical protein